MRYNKIRKHRKLLKAGRWLNRRCHWVVKAAKWMKSHLSWLNRINPFRLLKKLDWYIIRKFIGTYFFAITLIISISIVFDVNENLAKFTQYHAPLWYSIITQISSPTLPICSVRCSFLLR